ncbi:MAG: methionyl-tRNA formyltransferase [Clostridiales bacterium]|jgi:methionyl-tRNA formyltransferase|nr:methionyl-tRNA formyltransferase [Clostridiales bacterium]
MRVIFLGTPAFALPSLEGLFARHEVVAAVTQPDRPKGRGHEVTQSPVKQWAEAHGVPVLQFERIRLEGAGALRACGADVMVTAAYGQLLSQEILDICPCGVLNVHASLLPEYRGSAPVQWALMYGETDTGVTIMRTEAGLDTGAVLLSVPTQIEPEETAGALTARLAVIGAEALLRVLDTLPQGLSAAVKQDEMAATYFPRITRETARIDFSRGAVRIVNLVRAMNPQPGATFTLGGAVFKVWTATALPQAVGAVAGTVLAADSRRGLVIAAGDGAVSIDELTPQGGKRMSARAYLAGKTIQTGARCE